jgi:chaperonin GroES
LGAGRLLDDGSRSEFAVAKGQQVLFTSYAGTEVEWEGAKYLIMSENDILGIIG